MTDTGTRRRLHRLLRRDPSVILPLDAGLIDGPSGSLERTALLLGDEAFLSGVDAVLGFRGLLQRHEEQLMSVPFILNLSASTTLVTHTRKTKISSVEAAVRLGADAVAYQLNFSDEHESVMLRDFGKVVEAAAAAGIPTVAIAYPRKSVAGADENYNDMCARRPKEYSRLVRHVVRAAVELGADVVKTTFTGSAESFHEVVDAACGVPVLIAGGPLASRQRAIERACAAVAAGARGVAYGRQLFQDEQPTQAIRELREALTSARIARPATRDK